jgi:hypothetical protein
MGTCTCVCVVCICGIGICAIIWGVKVLFPSLTLVVSPYWLDFFQYSYYQKSRCTRLSFVMHEVCTRVSSFCATVLWYNEFISWIDLAHQYSRVVVPCVCARACSPASRLFSISRLDTVWDFNTVARSMQSMAIRPTTWALPSTSWANRSRLLYVTFVWLPVVDPFDLQTPPLTYWLLLIEWTQALDFGLV